MIATVNAGGWPITIEPVPGEDAHLEAAWRRWLPGRADSVIARYREPHRRYHGVYHLARVVDGVGRLLAEVAVDDPATVVAAAFFHDAVYDPTSSTNEADSARLAESTFTSWGSTRCAEVTRLILATAGHTATDLPTAVLLDADLAVLGAEPAAYAAYARGVRAEYHHVDDSAWRVGRAAVLGSFLARPCIFQTASMQRLEASARANLTAELASLR